DDGDGRDVGDEEQGHHHAAEQRDDVLGDAFDLDIGHAAAHKQAGADGRGDRADAQVGDEHQAEVDRAHANAGGDGQEERGADQDGGGQAQEAAAAGQAHSHDARGDVAV